VTNSSSPAVLTERLRSTVISADHRSAGEEEVVELFRELRNPMLRYVLTFGIAAHDGEEIVQEVFLALFEHLKRGKSRANLRGWVFRVGHNLALKHVERARGKNAVVTPQFNCVESHVDSSLNPEELFAEAQRRQRLQAVLEALPEQDRYCVCLRAEGMRYREIAEIVGMSLGAVSISLARSLARFERADQE
jgi:RNA polymerase sigma-70 factor (ECF subfamily)